MPEFGCSGRPLSVAYLAEPDYVLSVGTQPRRFHTSAGSRKVHHAVACGLRGAIDIFSWFVESGGSVCLEVHQAFVGGFRGVLFRVVTGEGL